MNSDHFVKGLVGHIRQKKELASLPDSFILRALEDVMKKNAKLKKQLLGIAENMDPAKVKKSPVYKRAFKEMRAILRKQHGMFAAKERQDNKRRLSLLDELEKKTGNGKRQENKEHAQEKILIEIMRTHPSTNERLKDYPAIYGFCFKEEASEKSAALSILDLGAGINCASSIYWGRKCSYLGYDISIEEVSAETRICEAQGIRGKGEVFDLGRLGNKKEGKKEVKAFSERIEKDAREVGINLPFDICLLWKTADVLEKQQRGITKELLELVPANGIIVSFATKSLGQGNSFQKRRPWFENMLKHKGWSYSVLETDNETFYRMEKQN